MAVEVLAVEGVDVVSHPEPRIGEADPARARALAERLEGEALGIARLLELQRRGLREPAALEPGLDQVMVVVAGDDDQLAAGEGRAELGDHRLGDLEHLRERPIAKLEHVAEQHQAVDAGDRLDQPRPESLAAQEVRAAAEPEMEVGDDRGDHGAIVAAAAARVRASPGSGAGRVPTAPGATIGHR